MLIRPAPGIKVRHPKTHQHIPADGIEVSDADPYWARRLRDGDVILVKPVKVVTAKVKE